MGIDNINFIRTFDMICRNLQKFSKFCVDDMGKQDFGKYTNDFKKDFYNLKKYCKMIISIDIG